jgi:phage terminase Nu1 subunit (DNA packaging protein)
MGIRILQGYEHEHSITKSAIMFSSSTDWAFGPVFMDEDDHDAFDRAQMFIEWLPRDAREYEDNELERKYSEFRRVEADLWKAKEKKETEDDE